MVVHDVFLPAIRKRTSRPVILIADNFGSHDSTDAALQDQQVKWVLLPPNCTSVHQPMDQGIIAVLKRKYKSKMLHAMVKNLERYDELRAVGASIAAGVRGMNHAYPPNLLDAATIAHKVWESIDQSTLLNCWLKADILPTCHAESLQTYRRPLTLPAVEELSSLLQLASLSSQASSQDGNDQPPPAIEREHLIGEFIALQWQAENDPAGLADVLNDWFDIEDDDLVRQEEVEMALEKEQVQPTAGNNENPMENDPSSSTIALFVRILLSLPVAQFYWPNSICSSLLPLLPPLAIKPSNLPPLLSLHVDFISLFVLVSVISYCLTLPVHSSP